MEATGPGSIRQCGSSSAALRRLAGLWVALALFLAPSAWVCAQPASVSVNVVSPAAGALAGDDLLVVATVSSTFELKEVVARVEGRESSLLFSSAAYSDQFGSHPGWTGALSLAGLVRGPKILAVQATDFLGNTSQALTMFIHDRKPILTVNAPLMGTVARPQLRLAVSCTDDDPAGCSLIVSVGGFMIATGRDHLDQGVSLADFEGSAPTLHIEAVDSAGQRSAVDVPVYVESSVRLHEVESVSGAIWDVDMERFLFLESRSDRGVLKIRQRGNGQDSVVMDEAGRYPRYGYLAPQGAIFLEQSGDVLTALVYDDRDGALTSLGFPNSTQSLVAKGDYAIWNNGGTLILRDLVAGQNTTVTAQAGNWKNDVALSGDVVYWGDGYNIYRYRSGTITPLTTDTVLWNVYPLTDGQGVVYLKEDPCCGLQRYGLYLHDGTREVELAPLAARPVPSPSEDYQINNGWVAFTRPGTGGQLQVWTRSPSGQEAQVTFYGDSSRISALAPNGELMFLHNGRYLSRPGEPPIEINSSLGNPFWEEGQWWMTLGRTLFQVQPSNTAVSLDEVKVADQKFTFRVNAGEGQTVVIQASRDLAVWADMATQTVTGGEVEFVGEPLGSLDRRFYRAITP
jgi:hypothetical protein